MITAFQERVNNAWNHPFTRSVRDYKYAENLFGVGLTKSQAVKKSFLGGVGYGAFGMATGVALIGFQAKRAGRGGFVPAIVGQTAAMGIGIPIAGVASATVACIPGVGPLAAVLIGSVLSDYAELRIGSQLIKGVRTFTNLHKNVRHLEMGGSYQDSEIAWRQRQIAVQDMNASMLPGRRYLGQEALLMHR